MSTTTSNLGLFKYDTTLDAEVPFSIDDALNQNWNKIDSSVVKKSGDTMTGLLNINSADGYYSGLQLQHPDYETGSTPENNLYFPYFKFVDKNERQLAEIYHTIRTTGESNFVINSKSISDSGSDKYIIMSQKKDGSFAFTFPNTTCVDGQWVSLSQVIISSNTSIKGSTPLTYTLNLPTNGAIYEVLIYGEITVEPTSGNYVTGKVQGSKAGLCSIGRATTRSSSTVYTGGSGIVIVGSNRKITVERSTNWNGHISYLVASAYRRVGTNA